MAAGGSHVPGYRRGVPYDWLPTLPLTAANIGSTLRAALAHGALDLPLPGEGQTLLRWSSLAELSAADLSLGRLAEAHTDAHSILAELDAASEPGQLWGVWAAESSPVAAVQVPGGWQLTGRKDWCSGAYVLDRALVTARHSDERRLFAVDLTEVLPVENTWQAVGLEATGSVSVLLAQSPAVPVGGPSGYLERAGFWHGGAGVAACWYGGALGAGRVLLHAARARPRDAHALAHLGAVDALLTGVAAHLAQAADQLDRDPGAPFRAPAARLRAHVESVATEVLDRVGRALGPGPLCQDPVQARRAADLPVYLRQSHAEHDLATLGELAVQQVVWG